MVTCTTPPFRAAVRLNSGVRPRDTRMSERVAKAICYMFLLAGVALLGLATPWLKSLGTAAYVGLSLIYMLALASVMHQIYNRLKPAGTDQDDHGAA